MNGTSVTPRTATDGGVQWHVGDSSQDPCSRRSVVPGSRAPTDTTQLHGSDRSPQRRPLDQFDEDDNFGPTTLTDEDYATLAETWLGVPAGDLLPALPTAPVGSRILSLRLGVRRAQNQCAGPSALT